MKNCDFFEGTEQYRDFTINYPQIRSDSNSKEIEKANALIRQVAYSFLGDTYEETVAYLEEWQKDSPMGEASVDYKIIHFSHDHISVIFYIIYVTGGPTYEDHYMTSVDLGEGEEIRLDDIISEERVIDAIRDGDFEVYIGTWSEVSEEYLHNPEIIERMIEEFKNSLGREYPKGFDRSSSRNIGMDEEDIYIRIYLPYVAFHDYVILCIPMDAVKN